MTGGAGSLVAMNDDPRARSGEHLHESAFGYKAQLAAQVLQDRRETIATAIFAGLLSRADFSLSKELQPESARRAVSLADALIAEIERTQPKAAHEATMRQP